MGGWLVSRRRSAPRITPRPAPVGGGADQVRAGLLSLAGFALRHGHQALTGKVGIAPLIDINMAMMRGLRQEAPA